MNSMYMHILRQTDLWGDDRINEFLGEELETKTLPWRTAIADLLSSVRQLQNVRLSEPTLLIFNRESEESQCKN